MKKLEKNYQSKKKLNISLAISITQGYLPVPWGYIHMKNHSKIYVKSEFKAVLLKLTANDQ